MEYFTIYNDDLYAGLTKIAKVTDYGVAREEIDSMNDLYADMYYDNETTRREEAVTKATTDMEEEIMEKILDMHCNEDLDYAQCQMLTRKFFSREPNFDSLDHIENNPKTRHTRKGAERRQENMEQEGRKVEAKIEKKTRKKKV